MNLCVSTNQLKPDFESGRMIIHNAIQIGSESLDISIEIKGHPFPPSSAQTDYRLPDIQRIVAGCINSVRQMEAVPDDGLERIGFVIPKDSRSAHAIVTRVGTAALQYFQKNDPAMIFRDFNASQVPWSGADAILPTNRGSFQSLQEGLSHFQSILNRQKSVYLPPSSPIEVALQPPPATSAVPLVPPTSTAATAAPIQSSSLTPPASLAPSKPVVASTSSSTSKPAERRSSYPVQEPRLNEFLEQVLVRWKKTLPGLRNLWGWWVKVPIWSQLTAEKLLTPSEATKREIETAIRHDQQTFLSLCEEIRSSAGREYYWPMYTDSTASNDEKNSYQTRITHHDSSKTLQSADYPAFGRATAREDIIEPILRRVGFTPTEIRQILP